MNYYSLMHPTLLAAGLALGSIPVMAENSINLACGTRDALSPCLEAQAEFLQAELNNGKNRYVADSLRYFLTMKTDLSSSAALAKESEEQVSDYLRPLQSGEWNPINKWFSKSTIHPHYAPLAIRYEFPPWLLTTGYGEITLKNVDESLRLYATDYKSLACFFFPVQPFGRCHVVFLYGKDDPKTAEDDRTECPIYEEFTFNNQGKITFIEAWTDHDGYLPMDSGDYWAEGPAVKRLSTAVPGLGNATGLIEPRSAAMQKAAEIFDRNYSSEFWDPTEHKLGPFASMLHDINGKLNKFQLPAPGVLSIWPSWLQRTLAHQGKNVLDGCKAKAP